jgi:flagellar biosynthesis protein FlgN
MIMIEKTFPITEKLILDALNLAEQLYLQLNKEAETLKQPQHTESIQLIANSKKQLVAKLEHFNSQLVRVLSSENLPNNQQGLAEYFKRAEAANFAIHEATKNWEAIRIISIKSKILNDQNGASLDILARHTKSSLQILKGKPQFANTYGPDGARKSDTYTRTLVLA